MKCFIKLKNPKTKINCNMVKSKHCSKLHYILSPVQSLSILISMSLNKSEFRSSLHFIETFSKTRVLNLVYGQIPTSYEHSVNYLP